MLRIPHSMAVIGLICLLFSPASADPIPLDVILMGGQSNSVGAQSLPRLLPAALRQPSDTLPFFYSRGERFDYTAAPLTTVRPGAGGDSGRTGYGAEITFGNALETAFPSRRFGIIKSAQGGTSLASDWDPQSGSTYARFRQTVTDGMAALADAGYAPTVTAMLWTQGEADTGRSTTAYVADLTDFIADVRSDHGSELLFLISKLSTRQAQPGFEQNFENIRRAQDLVAAGDELTFALDTEDLTVYEDERIHFDSLGQQRLGAIFAEAYVAAVPEPSMALFLLAACAVVARLRRPDRAVALV